MPPLQFARAKAIKSLKREIASGRRSLFLHKSVAAANPGQNKGEWPPDGGRKGKVVMSD